LRDLVIDDPDATSCASHTRLTGKRDRAPLGPALQRRADHVEQLDQSRDTEQLRRLAIGIVTDIKAVDVTELTMRERVALHLVEQWGDGRGSVQLDRVIDALMPRSENERFTPSLAAQILDSASGAELSMAKDDRQLLERLTLPGRAVLFVSLLGGVVATYVTFILLYENLPVGSTIPIAVLILSGVLTWGALLLVGIKALPLLGTTFLRGSGSDA
jgi:hypothetical protein